MAKHIPWLILIAALLAAFLMTDEFWYLRSATILVVVHFIKSGSVQDNKHVSIYD